MKDSWPRTRPILSPDRETLAATLSPVVDPGRLQGWRVLPGGLSHTTLRLDVEGGAPLVLRLFQGDGETALFEQALSRRCGAMLRMPEVLHAGVEPVPFTLSRFVEGVPPHRLDPPPAREIGRVLAGIHNALSFERSGFLGPDMTVVHPVPLDGAGLLAFLEGIFADGPAADRLGPTLTAALVACVQREGSALAEWCGAPCLVHSDYNPWNLLCTGAGEVSAVLDWEFAHAGTPATDFGNLLRPPFGDDPAFAELLASGYVEAGGWLPEKWRRLAQLADLFAWADFLRRPDLPEIVLQDTRTMIARITH
ncbi:aminoglycoside phosphotransferase [Caenispirillum salinarum AK4]|uniref:Aminoglycoside phosphotransferase n=1 Tax=Caenispirillum salinarum AK4 TaxID=1238182 RepID=K9GWG4_9PROT|nr:phosphotransferase [Caenispirillum salinarum]EKV29587.1 aminoglycoside phosphotransferase [Caenispirillum salinarum AK4]